MVCPISAALYELSVYLHKVKFRFEIQGLDKTEAGQSSREREIRTAAALLRVLWIFAKHKACYDRSSRVGGWEGVTEGTHARSL